MPKSPQGGSNRENQEWLDDLRGINGAVAQRSAHEDLANYLYVVVYNHLLHRRGNIAALAYFSTDELVELAQDFVQETLEKIGQDNFRRLDQYRGKGHFRSWTAQIITNHASSELRRPYWSRRQILSEAAEAKQEDQKNISPENAALQEEAGNILYRCIDKLQERHRVAFLRCIAEGERAGDVAEDLGTTANVIYILIYRAKRIVRKCIEKSGLGADVLDIY